MSVLRGKTSTMGSTTAISTLRNWQINENNAIVPWVGSNSDGAMSHTEGNSDWNGSGSYYGTVPAAFPGEAFDFIGLTGTDRVTGTAIVDSITIDCDIAAGGHLSGVVNFSANGTLLTIGAALGTMADASAPAIKSAKLGKINWGAADRTDGLRWSMTISSANDAYFSSAAAGIPQRTAGNISANGSWSELESTTANLLIGGTIAVLKLYVDATTFYEYNYAIIKDEGMPVDIEGASYQEVAYNWEFTGRNAAGTKGSIKKPDTTAFWD